MGRHQRTEPIEGKFDLFLGITVQTAKKEVSESYQVEFVETPPAARLCVRLRKESDNEVRDVTVDDWGVARCTCPDNTYHPERPGGCKHIVALRSLIVRLGPLAALLGAPTEGAAA